MSILIADSGSTKTDWVLLSQKEIKLQMQTIGFSPYFQTSEEIATEITTVLLPQLVNELSNIEQIYYYGTGCSSDDKKGIISQAIQQSLGNIPTEINHDLLASARALCGNEKGIACILGTGSNSCLYNGTTITENVTSYGYLFGDHGSGAVLGKTLVQYYFDGKLPQSLTAAFEAAGYNKEVILDNVYKKQMPNRYLASLCLFISQHQQHETIQLLIKQCFADFFEYQVSKYTHAQQLPINAVGSVAYNFKQWFAQVATEKGFTVGDIIQSPMEGLIKYHR